MNNFTSIPIIETERLVLRSTAENDAADTLAIYSENIVARGLGINPIKDISDAIRLIRYFKRSFDETKMLRFGIELKAENKLIGLIGFQDIKIEYYLTDIGFELNPAYHKKGIMREAIVPVLRYCFDTLNFHKISSLVYTFNDSSCHLLENAGFKREGLLHKHMYNWYTKEFLDMYSYGLINTDWKKV